MSRFLPAIPDPQLTLESLRESILALKEVAENFAGVRGPSSTTVATTDAVDEQLATQDAALRALIASLPSGTVTNVTATAPLSSSGGATPDLSLTGIVGVPNGGTGQSALTANNVLLGNGPGAVNFVAPGASGNILTSDGTTWQSVAPSQQWGRSLKTSTQALTSTTFADVAGLSFPVAANKTYIARGAIVYTTSAGAGFGLGFNGPASPVFAALSSGFASSSGLATTSYNTAAGVFQVTGNGSYIAQYLIYVQNGPNAGTVTLRALLNAGTSGTSVLSGSYIEWAEVI